MALSNLVTLEPDSEEYAAVRCMLSNSTQGQGTVSGVVVQKVNCPEVYKRFDRACRKKLKVIGWSNMHEFSSDNDAENISKRGLVLNKGIGGFEFRVGVVNESLVPKLMDPHVEHTLLYSNIAVGRSYVDDKKLHDKCYLRDMIVLCASKPLWIATATVTSIYLNTNKRSASMKETK